MRARGAGVPRESGAGISVAVSEGVTAMTARSAIIDGWAVGTILFCKTSATSVAVLTYILISAFALTIQCHADIVEDRRIQQSAIAATNAIRFDVPSQFLEDALIAYAEITGVEVFLDHALAAGQYSRALQGEYSAEAALRALLAGTGLQIRRAAEHAYTVVAPGMQEPAIGRAPSWGGDREREALFAALQAAVMQALCMQPSAVLDQHRVAVAVWIDASGKVTDARILTAQIDDNLSRGIVAGFLKVSGGQPRPAGLQQPITFVILARSPDRARDCASLNSGRG